MITEPSRIRPATATEAAETLGVSDKTITEWIARYSVPGATRKGRQWAIGQQALEALKTISELRDVSGEDTIRRTIGAPRRQPDPDQLRTFPGQSGPNSEPLQPAPNVSDRTPVTLDQVRQALTEHDGLAEKLSRATYTIGQLEERTRGQANRIRELEAQLTEKDRLLEARSRPWWKRLIGLS